MSASLELLIHKYAGTVGLLVDEPVETKEIS